MRRALITVAVLASCGPAAWKVPPPGTHRDRELVAAIDRDACLERCPEYSLAIYADGTVDYKGRENVDTKGLATWQISATALAKLEATLAGAHLERLLDAYDHEDCTDLEAVEIWSSPRAGHRKHIVHFHGDERGPPILVTVESAIDVTAGVERWIGRRAFRIASERSSCHEPDDDYSGEEEADE